ncbi:hypothetical protein MA16_Dca025280 [Dendrobium catenatum]|uniref:Uncharacterized protein n=1 Tax=Dendrobium catenatum TaxID=906689 RepID=A0A2I0WNC7_9ASPA|nr:hypothetical protein MA16_Dca025280 [Dendrobium catenatum]
MISGLDSPRRFWIVLGRSVHGKIPRAKPKLSSCIVLQNRPLRLEIGHIVLDDVAIGQDDQTKDIRKSARFEEREFIFIKSEISEERERERKREGKLVFGGRGALFVRRRCWEKCRSRGPSKTTEMEFDQNLYAARMGANKLCRLLEANLVRVPQRFPAATSAVSFYGSFASLSNIFSEVHIDNSANV